MISKRKLFSSQWEGNISFLNRNYLYFVFSNKSAGFSLKRKVLLGKIITSYGLHSIYLLNDYVRIEEDFFCNFLSQLSLSFPIRQLRWCIERETMIIFLINECLNWNLLRDERISIEQQSQKFKTHKRNPIQCWIFRITDFTFTFLLILEKT